MRQNSISAPVIVIIVAFALCELGGIVGLINRQPGVVETPRTGASVLERAGKQS